MTDRLPYTGWLRHQGGDWRAAVSAPTWEAAWRALLAVSAAAVLPAPDQGGRLLELLVNSGSHPDDRRRPR